MSTFCQRDGNLARKKGINIDSPILQTSRCGGLSDCSGVKAFGAGKPLPAWAAGQGTQRARMAMESQAAAAAADLCTGPRNTAAYAATCLVCAVRLEFRRQRAGRALGVPQSFVWAQQV